MKDFFKQMLSSAKTGTVSSKRVCGVLMILVACFCAIYCCATGNSSPDMITTLIIAACTCLGCEGLFDSISSWKNRE